MRVARVVGMALALSLALSASARAQPAAGTDEATVAAYFAHLVEHPEELRAIQEEFSGPMSDALWATMAEAFLPVLRDPAYPGYVSGRLVELVSADITAEALLRNFAGLGDAWSRGLLRLPQKKLGLFYAVTLEELSWHRESDRAACNLLADTSTQVEGTLLAIMSVEAQVAASVVARIGTPFFEANLDIAALQYTLLAEAALAEVNASPDRRPLDTGPRATAAMSDLMMAFYDRLLGLPDADALIGGAMAARITNRDAAAAWPAEAACDVSWANLAALWDLPPPQRGLVIDIFATWITEPETVEHLLMTE